MERIPDIETFRRQQMEAARRDVLGLEQTTGLPVEPREMGPLTPTMDVSGPSPVRAFLGVRKAGTGTTLRETPSRAPSLLDMVELSMKKNPEETRMKLPAHAVALADAYLEILAQNKDRLGKYQRDIAQKGIFGSLFNFLTQNPDAREELNRRAEEKYGSDLAAKMGYTSTVRARRLPPENK
jgi:hypothetical protein